MRNLIGVFSTKEVVASRSAYGRSENKGFDQDIIGGCLSKYLYDCVVNDDNYDHIGYVQSKYQVSRSTLIDSVNDR